MNDSKEYSEFNLFVIFYYFTKRGLVCTILREVKHTELSLFCRKLNNKVDPFIPLLIIYISLINGKNTHNLLETIG